MDDQVTHLTRHCPQCRKALAIDAPEGLCGACLLTAGTETLTRSTVDDLPTMPAPADTLRVVPGQTWGGYRIGRLLGRGGMGEVYEAEQTETGRRLALKVLRSRLQNADDRARFLREGQLAASVSHPHTVYIFGSEEITGVPVISMELLPGGTLKDKVVAQGPLPPAEAVAAVLDIIGGLDAAQSAGILHRDIKPSNCFLDSDGAVKVGDFGLSISTLARDVRRDLVTEGFQGTPQFAPPEQLRGEPLDVRADIYAVGATLYYLLTGRAPFDAPDLRTLFARVTGEAPVSPRTVRREVPSGLANVVLRCLSKSPAGRPSSYAALGDALRPYARADEVPAPPGLRVMAGVVDLLIASMPATVWRAVTTDITEASAPTPAEAGFGSWGWLAIFAYFLVFEGWSNRSPGKRLFGLAVSKHGSSPVRQIAVRTAVFHLPYLLYTLGTLAIGPLPALASRRLAANVVLDGADMTRVMGMALVLLMMALLFVAARRGNGWAGLHELASGTRVVARVPVRRHERAPAATQPAPSGSHDRDGARFGPFVVSGHLAHRVREATLLGFDPLLRREVWVHVVPPGTPPIASVRRDLSRVSRLHWLTGRRSPTENWDAFEAPDGAPLLAGDDTATEWPAFKSRLLDLANELVANEQDRSTPRLSLDRVWVRRDGRLVLTDFAPPSQPPGDQPELASAALLASVAAYEARGASASTLPLRARTLIDTWAGQAPATLADARAALMPALSSPDRVSRRRRALPIALAAVPTIFLGLFTTAIALPTMNRFFGPETTRMLELLEWVYQSDSGRGGQWADPAKREASAIYLAGHHRNLMLDESFWGSPMMRQLKDRLQPVAARVAREQAAPTESELARAAATLQPDLTRRAAQRPQGFVGLGGVILTALTALSLLLTMACGLASAVIVRGGILTRLLGLAVVDRGGHEIGRLRSLARAIAAWSPAIIWLAYLAASPKVQGFVPVPPSPLLGTGLTLAALTIGAIWTIARPTRSPHDRVMGTWIVPR